MKKACLLIALWGLFAIAFTSCNKDVEKCWKVDVTIKYGAMETSITNYIWTSENEIEADIEELKREYADTPDIEFKIKKSVTTIKTEEACDDKNEPLFDY